MAGSHRQAASALLICVFVALFAAPAEARSKAKIPLKARRLFKAGTAEYNIGHFAKALVKFEAAAKIHSHPLFVLAIAQCHRQLGNLGKALFGYKLYRSLSHGRRFKDLDAKIAALEKRVAEQRAAAAGRKAAAERAAAVRRGAALGTLDLRGLPAGARVRVDGKDVDASAGGPLSLPFGAHAVRIDAEGYLPWAQEIDVRSQKRAVVSVKLIPRARPRSTGWLVGASVATAIAVAAEVTALLFTKMANDELETSEAFDRNRTLAITSHVVAGVAALGAIVGWVFYARSGGPSVEQAAEGRVNFAALPTAHGANLLFSISF